MGIIDINALNIPRGLSDDARASVDVSREVDGETVESVIFLIPTYPHFGGVRWWLSCPSCGGRSGKLYLPTPHGEFACRLCHDLTYESCLRSKASDAFVPLPIRRPGETGGDSRSPTLAAVVNETPGMRKLPSTTPSPDSWVELAELAPQEKALRGGRIASAFAPVPQPRKGARPSAADAGKGQITTRLAAPKLTEKIIAGWALDREEAETAPVAKVRGERFVASQLQAAPEEVYAAGFIPNGTSQPHNRFTGSAVNFIQIARFGPSS